MSPFRLGGPAERRAFRAGASMGRCVYNTTITNENEKPNWSLVSLAFRRVQVDNHFDLFRAGGVPMRNTPASPLHFILCGYGANFSMDGSDSITFDCPACQHKIEALSGRIYTSCEHCGEIAKVPYIADVDTLTLEEMKAAKKKADQEKA